MPSLLALLLAASAFAGSVSRRAVDGLPPPRPAPALPPSIVAADPARAPWLAAVVARAQDSPAARRVLRDVAAHALRTGRPAVVAIGRTELGGELDVRSGLVTLGASHLKEPLGSGATTLMHELRHWVQLRSGLPMDPLELELDAYLVDFRVARDLGDHVPPRSYDGRARAAFVRGLGPFLRFLARHYPEDPVLRGSSLKAFERGLAVPPPARSRRRRDLAWLSRPANRRRLRAYVDRLYARARALSASYRIP